MLVKHNLSHGCNTYKERTLLTDSYDNTFIALNISHSANPNAARKW